MIKKKKNSHNFLKSYSLSSNQLNAPELLPSYLIGPVFSGVAR